MKKATRRGGFLHLSSSCREREFKSAKHRRFKPPSLREHVCVIVSAVNHDGGSILPNPSGKDLSVFDLIGFEPLLGDLIPPQDSSDCRGWWSQSRTR